jgi:homoserine kinase
VDAIRFRLPATSANLGPGFDALGLAMALFLEVEASEAEEFSIVATGRNVAQVSSLRRNLMIDTYRSLAPLGRPLALRISNQIPLGMGCGSSAAALLAGVLLGNHFGGLGMTRQEILEEACRREGHPDNVAACFYGGFTASSMQDGRVTAVSFGEGLGWRLLLALPKVSLATEKARALLPDFYSRADVVENIQATALLVGAFALGRPELLRVGTRDRVHQPFRGEACPLLPLLLPLVGQYGVESVTLSGAGPSVLLILGEAADTAVVGEAVRKAAGDPDLELVETRITGGLAE